MLFPCMITFENICIFRINVKDVKMEIKLVNDVEVLFSLGALQG